MHFESLHQTHAEALLLFEKQNRAFFERVITARDDAFYSMDGVRQHINLLTRANDADAYLLIDGSEIIARANLKQIQANHDAEIGYRVSQSVAGKGVGSRCVDFVIRQARKRQLTQLYAYVMANNPASEKVLVNNGFEITLCLPDEFVHQGRTLNGFKYQRQLAL